MRRNCFIKVDHCSVFQVRVTSISLIIEVAYNFHPRLMVFHNAHNTNGKSAESHQIFDKATYTSPYIALKLNSYIKAAKIYQSWCTDIYKILTFLPEKCGNLPIRN